MSVEFDVFLTTEKKWFCHFDDDNYVNIPRLVDLLKTYKPSEEWYLGKPSIRRPLEILDRETGKEMTFWFATGGAGFCLSRSLALKMQPIARYDAVQTISRQLYTKLCVFLTVAASLSV